MRASIDFRQRRDLGDVLNATFLFLRQNLRPLGKSLLYLAAPAWLLLSVPNALLQVRLFSLDPASPDDLDVGALGLQYVLVMGLVLFASVVEVLVVYGFMVRYQERDGAAGPGTEDVWRFVRAHFWRVVGVFVVAFAAMVGGAVLVIVPCLGALAFMAGLFYLGVVVSIAVPVLLREETGVAVAFTRARALIRGAFWQTFAVLFVAWMLVSILGFLFNVPSMVLVFAGTLHDAGPDGALGVAAVAAGVLATLSSALLYPIPLVAAGLQYFSLVEEKERVGLMERIDALQGPEQDAFWQEEPPKP